MKLGFIASTGVLVGCTASVGFLGAIGPQFLSVPDTVGQETTSRPGAIRVTTKLISVSVIVHDKHGQSLTDLTKDDFVLLDGRKPRAIQVFSMDKTDVVAAPERTVPPDTYSNEIGGDLGIPSNLTVILLDSLNTEFFDRAYSRSQVNKLLLTLQPQDRVALYVLGSRLRVLHDFTSDASTLIAALKENKEDGLLDVDVAEPGQTSMVNKHVTDLASEARAVYSKELAQNRAGTTAEALRTIAGHVSYLPGRKNLIWISDNFPFNLQSNNLQRTADGKKLALPTDAEMVERALSNAHIAVYPIDARGLTTGGLSEVTAESISKEYDEMSKFANMEMVAQRTGGRAYHDTNGIKESIRQTIDGSRVTYQLGFYPEDVVWDGSFHKLRVRVNRPDVQIQARDGYFALAEPNLTPEILRVLISQAARSLMEATAIRFSLHVTPGSPAIENKLTLSFSLDPRQFAFESQNGEFRDLVDIAFIALDANNRIIQTTLMPLPLRIDTETYEQLVKSGLPLARDLAIPPNASELRVVVYDQGNNQIGSVRVPLAPYLTKRSN
jgi:VWFA-related protein